MKRIVTLIILATFISLVFGYDDDYSEKASFGIIVAEFGGCLVGGVSGFFVGALMGGSASESHNSYPSPGFDPSGFSVEPLIFGTIGWIFGCAIGTCIVGSAFHQEGNFLLTLTGATLGTVAGGSSFLIDPYLGIASTVVLPPLGAIIGYNLSRRSSEYTKGSIWNKFDSPSFCFRTERTKEYKIIPVYDFRLVNARF